jgi:hypothetical protein
MSSEPVCTDTSRTARPVDGESLVPQQPTPATVGSHRRSATGWRARLRRTPGGALLLQGLVFTAGLAFVVLGLVLIVAPGPLTIPPILLGLWIWSTEFAWADRQLDRAKASARVAWEDAKRRPVVSGMVTGGGLVGLGIAIWLVARYELVAQAREVVGV